MKGSPASSPEGCPGGEWADPKTSGASRVCLWLTIYEIWKSQAFKPRVVNTAVSSHCGLPSVTVISSSARKATVFLGHNKREVDLDTDLIQIYQSIFMSFPVSSTDIWTRIPLTQPAPTHLVQRHWGSVTNRLTCCRSQRRTKTERNLEDLQILQLTYETRWGGFSQIWQQS